MDQLCIIEGDIESILTGSEGNGLIVETDGPVIYRTESKVHGSDIVEPKSMEIDAIGDILELDCILDNRT